ncbi:MAG: queuosine precursor transporter [Planctomycetes bacterium]|nr:queuosine precursor transporter [Planctomycetota bacterium]
MDQGLPYRYINSVLHERRERVFLVFAGLFLGSMTMLNILGISRFIKLATMTVGQGTQTREIVFAVAVGVIPYPLTFLCTDFISEFYGRRRANFLVWVGLAVNFWVVFILWLGGVLPGFVPNDPTTGFPPQPVYDAAKHVFVETGWTFYQIKALTFGAVAASMCAYMAAQFCDVFLFHFWKDLTKGKHLWLRNNGSTMVSQMVDTVAVILITHFYAHALPVQEDQPLWPQLLTFIGTSYAFKFVVAALDTIPFYLGVYYLSRYLRIDPTQEHDIDAEETPAAD